MKTFKIFIIFIPILFFEKSFSQEVVVSCDKSNVLYYGVENPISVLIEDLSCSAIYLTASSGKLSGDSCKYWLTIDEGFEYREVRISVYAIINQDTILKAVKDYRINKLSLVADVSGLTSSYIKKDSLLNAFKIQQYPFIRVSLPGYILCPSPFKIKSFCITVLRDSMPVYQETTLGSRISNDFLTFSSQLEKGDIVVFHDIYLIHKVKNRYSFDYDFVIFNIL